MDVDVLYERPHLSRLNAYRVDRVVFIEFLNYTIALRASPVDLHEKNRQHSRG